MPTSTNRLLTIGEIARRTGSDIHKVEYVIKSRQINPVGRAGNARVFSETDADRIGTELEQIEAKRAAGGGR